MFVLYAQFLYFDGEDATVLESVSLNLKRY